MRGLSRNTPQASSPSQERINPTVHTLMGGVLGLGFESVLFHQLSEGFVT